jgi:hypothetical protein
MTVNEKLLQYAEYKGISQRKFTRSLNLSEGVLRKGKNIGSGYLNQIKEKYHDLNMNWLLFDEGDMILDQNVVNESQARYEREKRQSEKLEQDLTHCKELLQAKEETISILKHQLGLNGNS